MASSRRSSPSDPVAGLAILDRPRGSRSGPPGLPRPGGRRASAGDRSRPRRSSRPAPSSAPRGRGRDGSRRSTRPAPGRAASVSSSSWRSCAQHPAAVGRGDSAGETPGGRRPRRERPRSRAPSGPRRRARRRPTTRARAEEPARREGHGPMPAAAGRPAAAPDDEAPRPRRPWTRPQARAVPSRRVRAGCRRHGEPPRRPTGLEHAAVSGDDAALAALRDQWPEIVAYISQHPPTKPLISACRPIAVDGAVVTLGFPEGKGFLKDIAERRRANLEEGIGHFLGRPVAVRCVATNIDVDATLPADDGCRPARRRGAPDLRRRPGRRGRGRLSHGSSAVARHRADSHDDATRRTAR